MKKILITLIVLIASLILAQDYDFSIYYDDKPIDCNPNVVQPDSITLFNIENLDKFKNILDENSTQMLLKNGFVVKKDQNYFDNYENFYNFLKNKEMPVFITSATLLHYYHIIFDQILKNTEEKYFYQDVLDLTKYFRDYYLSKYKKSRGIKKEVYKRNLIYFSVPYAILDETSLDEIKNLKKVYPVVQKELNLIKHHRGFEYSPLFIYKEDYSQYVPRGHYTASEKLKKYFLSMMWYGRMTMLIKGDNKIPKGKAAPDFPGYKALISKYDAKIQTMQAISITSLLYKNKELKQNWNKMYKIIAFFVGTGDDITPTQYKKILKKYFKRKKFHKFNKKKYFVKFQTKVAELNPPEIYGGTGDIGIFPPYSPDDLDKVLIKTMGFRLFGQKFIPDSYIFTNLVYPKVDKYLGNKKPFTMVPTQAGPTRGFPRGLDVFAVLGSNLALQILQKEDDTNYENFEKQFNLLKDEFSSFTEKDWHKNLYWNWLYSLKKLNEPKNTGYPKFMTSTAWQTRVLNTTLSSWTELRHDTILYAKQSYTPRKLTSIGPHGHQFKYVLGYLEPQPEFYAILKSITDMTKKGLEELKLDAPENMSKLTGMSNILNQLIKISIKELKNEKLEKREYDFLNNFGRTLKNTIGDVKRKVLSTILVADVHTDGNTNKVLEEATGYLNAIIVAVPMNEHTLKLFIGPEPSYYEFKQPMSDRLTDEKWKRMIINKHPNPPKFIDSYYSK